MLHGLKRSVSKELKDKPSLPLVQKVLVGGGVG